MRSRGLCGTGSSYEQLRSGPVHLYAARVPGEVCLQILVGISGDLLWFVLPSGLLDLSNGQQL